MCTTITDEWLGVILRNDEAVIKTAVAYCEIEHVPTQENATRYAELDSTPSLSPYIYVRVGYYTSTTALRTIDQLQLIPQITAPAPGSLLNIRQQQRSTILPRLRCRRLQLELRQHRDSRNCSTKCRTMNW